MKLAMVEGGPHKVYEEIWKSLNKEFNMEIITGSKDFKYKNIKVKVLPIKRIISYSFTHYKGLYGYLKKKNFDIVHVRTWYRYYSFIALWYCILHNKRLVYGEEQHNNPQKFIENIFFHLWWLFMLPWIRLKASHIICPSIASAQYMKKKWFKNIEYIPVPYTPKVKKPKRYKKLKIICVARFEDLKDHHTLLSAISCLVRVKKIRDFELNLVGEGSLKRFYQNMVHHLKIEKYVNFVGIIPNSRINKFYQKHNLFILPSKMDPYGVTVLEAMSNGLPVIVSNKVGARCATRLCGFVFKDGNHIELAEDIKRYYKYSKLRYGDGSNALKWIKIIHNSKKIMKDYVALLKQ